MAARSIEIQADSIEVLGGGTISGQVVIRCDEEINCRKVTISRFWRTAGRGNTDIGGNHDLVLHQGSVPSGQSSYPFKLELPPGPVSYHGQKLSLQWLLKANVDLPMAFDLHSELLFELKAGPKSASYDNGPLWNMMMYKTSFIYGAPWKFSALVGDGNRPEDQVKPEPIDLRGSPAVGLLMAFFGLVLVLGGAGSYYLFMGQENAAAYILGGIQALCGLLLLYFATRRYLIRQRVRQAEIEIESRVIKQGRESAFKLRVRFSRELTIENAALLVQAWETVIHGSGKQRHSETAKISELEVPICTERTLSGSEPSEFSGSIRIPAEAPCTFVAPNNRVEWIVLVQVAIRDCPDLQGKVAISVRA